ncbi:hypothetical protein CLV28_2559 [Sediminihabitans luteus]|uniref:ATP/GTP-binding protein n=1 Tax=Sediminihabitans luteus TaxID=1138585 RepID=A0A2M9CDS2_9CELL|nr:hypothetical protein [Sediminihabitans luteus]PJJ70081.1 hypothetical protein CLV28_2559 [Sediminihabitans luteus]
MPSSRRSSRRPWGAEHVPLDVERATGGRRTESADDGEWTVQKIRSSSKTYTCPGCSQDVVPGTAHVVAWSNDSMFGRDAGLADRRHWHSACWQARARRR